MMILEAAYMHTMCLYIANYDGNNILCSWCVSLLCGDLSLLVRGSCHLCCGHSEVHH